ncbi:MAG: Methionine aminopeptidase 1 [Actinobacteria bacterium ADurb.Bin346]|nr:MAG: Methionine aminopeptidase 1 [Actinobacteria bacterium ADurb.Bin346]
MIICKSADEIRLMQKAAEIVAEVLLQLEKNLKPGMQTSHLDNIAEEMIIKRGAIPAFKGYMGKLSKRPYPSTICISINEEVVHGIPGKRIIREGDLVSVDVGVKYKGFFGDSARSFKVGDVGKTKERLYNATLDALNISIDKCYIGNHLSDISNAIETRASRDNFSVVKDFVGHGIGKKMHEEPQILNYGPPGQGPVLKRGMVLAIEPMINAGLSDVRILDDGWTVVTADRKCSCHFEDTIAITEKGPLILTRI